MGRLQCTSLAGAAKIFGRDWRLKRLIEKLVLFLVAVVFAVGLGEFAWRLLRSHHYGPTTNPKYVIYDSRLGWRYRPNSEARHTTEKFDVVVRFDSKGRRVPEHGSFSKPGRPRVVFLGDSLTFGWGVRAESTFPCVLSHTLGIEALNLGVAGYGTGQEFLLFQLAVQKEKPDAVVLTMCKNDLVEVLAGRRYGRPKPLITFDRQISVSIAQDRANILDRHSSLNLSFRFFLDRHSKRALNQYEIERGVECIRRLVHHMAIETVAMGATFVVVSEEIKWLTDGFFEAPFMDIFAAPVTYPSTPSAHHINLSPSFEAAANAGERVWIRNDGHWDVAGHQIVATEISPLLIDLAPNR